MNIFARFYFRAARLEREKRENKCSAKVSTFTVRGNTWQTGQNKQQERYKGRCCRGLYNLFPWFNLCTDHPPTNFPSPSPNIPLDGASVPFLFLLVCVLLFCIRFVLFYCCYFGEVVLGLLICLVCLLVYAPVLLSNQVHFAQFK